MLKFYTINAVALTVFLLLLMAGYFGNVPIWIYVLLIFLWFIVTAIGSFQMKWNYHFDSLHSNKNSPENWVAITFDDGPHPEFTPKVLKLLEAHNAKATFFLIGKNAENHPEIVKEILEKGHSIGNHSFSHSKQFGFFKKDKIVLELKQANAIVKKITGLEMKLFRPPFGVTNPNIKKALLQFPLNSIGWSKRSWDTTSLPQKTIINRITKNLQKGDIILLHDSSQKSVEVLEQLLLFLRTNHLQPVCVDQLLEISPYA